MSPSKFETCLHVLTKVKTENQTTLDELLSLAKLRRNELEYSLNLLVENFLVEEQIIFGNKIIYRVSDRGERVLNYFGINNVFSPKSKA